jgi:putative endonuclease
VYEHKEELADGFSMRHKVHQLVYFEEGFDITEAISPEKQLKRWNRTWKISLIEQSNPQWKDLSLDLVG